MLADVDGDVLHLRAVQVDVVRESFQIHLDHDALRIIFTNGRGDRLTIDDLIRVLGLDETPSSAEVYTEGRLLAFNLTLAAELKPRTATSYHRETFNAYRDWNSSTQRNDDLETAELSSAGYLFWHDINVTCEGRTFIVTEKGRYGIAPWVTKPGDICSVISGTSVPFLLRRPGPAKGEHLRLVGRHMSMGSCSGRR